MKGRDCDQRQRGRPAGHWPVLPTKCLRQHGWRATPSCAIGTTAPTREIGQIFILCMQLADFRNEIDILRLVVPEVRQILKAQRTAGFRSRVCCLRSWWLRQPRFTCILELGCGEGLNWELGGVGMWYGFGLSFALSAYRQNSSFGIRSDWLSHIPHSNYGANLSYVCHTWLQHGQFRRTCLSFTDGKLQLLSHPFLRSCHTWLQHGQFRRTFLLIY